MRGPPNPIESVCRLLSSVPGQSSLRRPGQGSGAINAALARPESQRQSNCPTRPHGPSAGKSETREARRPRPFRRSTCSLKAQERPQLTGTFPSNDIGGISMPARLQRLQNLQLGVSQEDVPPHLGSDVDHGSVFHVTETDWDGEQGLGRKWHRE